MPIRPFMPMSPIMPMSARKITPKKIDPKVKVDLRLKLNPIIVFSGIASACLVAVAYYYYCNKSKTKIEPEIALNLPETINPETIKTEVNQEVQSTMSPTVSPIIPVKDSPQEIFKAEVSDEHDKSWDMPKFSEHPKKKGEGFCIIKKPKPHNERPRGPESQYQLLQKPEHTPLEDRSSSTFLHLKDTQFHSEPDTKLRFSTSTVCPPPSPVEQNEIKSEHDLVSPNETPKTTFFKK